MGNLRESADWKWLLTVAVGLMVGGVGIAGWMGGGMVAIGALLPVWKGLPTIRRIRPRWPFHVPLPPDPDGKEEGLALKVKVQALQEEVRFLKISAAQTRQQIRERDTEIAKLTAELEREQELHRQAKVHATHLEYKIRYDIEPRPFDRAREVELEVAHNEMKNMRESLTVAGRGALDLAESLRHDMEGGNEMNRVIGRLLEEHRIRPTSRLFNRLAEELDARPHTDYREWLVHYYEAYNELRRTIIQMASFRKCELGDFNGYGEWCVHDAAFLDKVKDIGVMHEVIKAINKRHGYPLAMPGACYKP